MLAKQGTSGSREAEKPRGEATHLGGGGDEEMLHNVLRRLCGDVRRPPHLTAEDVDVNLTLVVVPVREGRVAGKHLVDEDAEGPDETKDREKENEHTMETKEKERKKNDPPVVDSLVVPLPLDQLRGEVLRSAAHRESTRLDALRVAEVNNLKDPSLREHEVLRLQVTVHNRARVDVAKRAEDARGVVPARRGEEGGRARDARCGDGGVDGRSERGVPSI